MTHQLSENPVLSGSPIPLEAFELDDSLLWVMHCAEGPVPKAAAEAVAGLLPKETQPWKMRWEEDFVALPLQVKGQAARLLGSRLEDITLTTTTTTALATVAQGFPWQPGDEVIIPLGEFPANAWPWLALAPRGVKVREVPLWEGHLAGPQAWESAPPTAEARPEERLLAAIGPNTRLLSVSWVRFQDGLTLDLGLLAEGCRSRGVELVVDGIQGLGTRALDLSNEQLSAGISAFAAGGHKGLLAPQGLALLWTEESFRNRLAPPGGWLSVEDATEWDRPSTDFDRGWQGDGRRLEGGVPNLLGCGALEQSLRLLADSGIHRIQAHISALQGRFLERLESLPAWRSEARRLGALWMADRLGSILSLHHGQRGPDGLGDLLRDGFSKGIYASIREGYLRLALHGYHRRQDVDRLLLWLAKA
ncbi:MAG: aminotransferase class V-fold PLP-dependent enzyme [Deltaproteobacteria bacterium]|nr:aminotransferase class V-fold PLP-dependent enzyme [Deltaproteobacteria bacterium]